MAEYINKVKIGTGSTQYYLMDSGALHDGNHKLSGTDGNFETTGTIKAATGIFNELIATTLDARTAKINTLTAENATVMGIMDVKGKLMTNSWEAASIANIGGSFYISPTGKDTGTPNVTITCNSVSNGAGTYTITVAKGTTSGQGNGFGVSSTSSSLWHKFSRVLMTGNVKFGTKNYPLGSLDGIVNAIYVSSNLITSITLNNITSSALDLIFSEQSTIAQNSSLTGTKNGSNMQISLYQYNNGTNSSGTYYPVGILLSSYGQSDQQQYIDIYGGSTPLGYCANGTTSLSTGMAEPTLRIGQLNGLPNIVDGSSDASTQPTGWGIYTTNGFFKGRIVSNAGKIGGFTIGTTDIHNAKTSYNNSNAGIYIGTDYVAGGAGNNWWIKSDGTFQFGGANGITYNGTTLSVPAANVSGTLSAGVMQTQILNALQANLTNANTNYLSAITADIGSITAGSISKGYNSINFNNTPATLEFKNNSTWDNSTQGIKYDSNGLSIKGAIAATSLTIGNGATITGLSTSNISGIDNYALQSSLNTEIAQRKATYGTCSTAAGTGSTTSNPKVVVCSDFVLYSGATITVTFSNANTVTAPYMRVNSSSSSDSKLIKSYKGENLTAAEYGWAAKSTITFTYDGTYWRMQDGGALQAKADASSSATAAAGSASSASTYASNASGSATAAASSASTASTKASEASTSATNAASSASTASTKASDASTSASNAATSATNASNSASAASTSATNASNSATAAADSVDWTVGIVVTAINYSANTATLSVTVYKGGTVKTSGFTRQWYKNSTAISGQTGATLSVTDLDASYTCIIS